MRITNFPETAEEEEEDVAEEGPREDSGLALAVADPSTYELEDGTWPPHPTSDPSPLKQTPPRLLSILPAFRTELYTRPSCESSHVRRWRPQPKFYTS